MLVDPLNRVLERCSKTFKGRSSVARGQELLNVDEERIYTTERFVITGLELRKNKDSNKNQGTI